MLLNFEQVGSFNTEMSVTPLKIAYPLIDPLILDSKDLLILIDASRTPHLLISEGSGIKTEGLIAPLKATTGLHD